ncbi:hypothetical protein D9M69_654690 [compost metagenome]
MTPSSVESVSPASMLTEPLNHQAMALATIRMHATATEARVASRSRRACSELEVIGAIVP